MSVADFFQPFFQFFLGIRIYGVEKVNSWCWCSEYRFMSLVEVYIMPIVSV